jgi:uncharacterized Zn-finger protein
MDSNRQATRPLKNPPAKPNLTIRKEPVRLPSLAETGLLTYTSKYRVPIFAPPTMPPLQPIPPVNQPNYFLRPEGSLDALVAASTADKENSPRHHCAHPGCGKVFPSKSRLQRHAVIHTGAKPFVCLYPECERTFSRRDNMLQHYRTHICAFPPGVRSMRVARGLEEDSKHL